MYSFKVVLSEIKLSPDEPKSLTIDASCELHLMVVDCSKYLVVVIEILEPFTN